MFEANHRHRMGLRSVVAVVGLLMGAVALSPPASAAPQDLFMDLTFGRVTVGDGSFDLPPGGGFNGTWDDETGEVAGELLVPTVETVVEPAPGVAADVVVDFTQQGDLTGTIDPDTGDAALSVTFRLDISVFLAGTPLAPEGCHVAPIDLDLTGVLDLDTGVLDLVATGFTVPPSQGCGDIAPILDDFISGDPTEAVFSLARVGGPIEPPPPVDPPPPADPPPADPPADDDGGGTTAPPATPISGTARLTG